MTKLSMGCDWELTKVFWTLLQNGRVKAIFSILASTIAAIWAIATYIFPPGESETVTPCVSIGTITAGRDITHNQINTSTVISKEEKEGITDLSCNKKIGVK